MQERDRAHGPRIVVGQTARSRGCRGQAAVSAADRPARLGALRETSALVLAGGPLLEALPALADRLAEIVRGGCLIRPTGAAPRAFAPASGHARAAVRAVLGDLVKGNPEALVSAYSTRVAQTGEPVFTPTVSSRVLRLWTQPAGWPFLDTFDICSALVVPVQRSRIVLGTVVVWREQPQPALTRAHLAFIEQIAQRLSSVLPPSVEFQASADRLPGLTRC